MTLYAKLYVQLKYYKIKICHRCLGNLLEQNDPFNNVHLNLKAYKLVTTAPKLFNYDTIIVISFYVKPFVLCISTT